LEELFIHLFECERDDLMDFILEYEGIEEEETKLVVLYAKIMNAYFQSDLETLINLLNKTGSLRELSSFHEDIHNLTQLRYYLKTTNNLEEIEKVTAPKLDFFSCEYSFIKGFSASRRADHMTAKKCFLNAYKQYAKIGAKKKSILSLQNYVSAETHLNPTKRMIPERQMLLKKSLEVNAKAVAGLASLDLSLEYEEIGATQMAIDFARQAIRLLESHTETYQHGCALIHHARICYKYQLKTEAQKSYSLLKTYAICEIKEQLKGLDYIIEGVNSTDKFQELGTTPWWQLHLQKNGHKTKLGKLPEKLIELLSHGPMNKEQIIEELYGSNMDYLSLENRFNVLLSRLRKKIPELIILQDDGLYALNTDSKIEKVVNA